MKKILSALFLILATPLFAQMYYGPFTANGSNLPPGAVTASYTKGFSAVTGNLSGQLTGQRISITNGINAVTGNFTGDVVFDTNTLQVDATNHRIGVGTPTPSTVFNIRSASPQAYIQASSGTAVLTVDSASGSDAWLKIQENGTPQWSIGESSLNGGPLFFSTGGTLTTPKMTLTSTPRLGIGTTTPYSTLQIAGTATINITKATTHLAIGGGESGINTYRLIGFGFVGSGATDVQPANIGYVETSNSGGTNGAIVFLTRSVTTSTATPSERMRIDSSGNVGIGLTNATHLLQVSTDDAAKPGVGGLWTVISDERVKTNIQDLDDGLGILNNLRVREFEYNKEACAYYKFPVGQKQYGFIAQEYEKVFPNDVKVTSGDTKIGKLCVKNLKQINTGQTSALVIRAIQQLDERLTALEKRLE